MELRRRNVAIKQPILYMSFVKKVGANEPDSPERPLLKLSDFAQNKTAY